MLTLSTNYGIVYSSKWQEPKTKKRKGGRAARVEDMAYYVIYGTGAGNEEVEGTLEDAMRAAEEGLSYTQKSVKIEDEDGEEVAVLPWYGTAPEEDDVVTCRFGDFGFYGEWYEV